MKQLYSKTEVEKMAIDISINKELGDKAQEFIDAYLATGHGCSDKPAEVILKNRPNTPPHTKHLSLIHI